MRALIWTAAVSTMFLGKQVFCADKAFPKVDWERISAAEADLDATALEQARDYALAGQGSGYITRHGRLVMSWGDVDQTYDLKSTTKSIGVTALGLAIGDGKVHLADKALALHPSFGTPPESNLETGWLGTIVLEHLATQTAGFEKPGGYGMLLFEPGTQWHYSDAGPNWLAECLTLAYRRDMDELLFERIFTPIGITRDDLRWRKNQYRDHQIDGVMRREFGSGVHANVDAMARLGLLYLREGQWNDQQLLPAEFVRLARSPRPNVVDLAEHDGGDSHGNASAHYGLLWWNNADGTLADVPRDAYWSWGLYDSLIVVIPSRDIVVSRAGKSWNREGRSGHYDVLKPFLGPIARAAESSSAHAPADQSRRGESPVAASRRMIVGIEWAPPETIVRRARGSDNWPLTWADDDAQYTAYGDGWGFEPRVPDKLSLGLVKIRGGPEDFRGINVRSPSLEARGNDVRGRKASGLLCIDGTLYLLARNIGNSQLAWSTDHGQTWEWADWRFTTSFGCPTFVNFGRDYAGARDDFVYVVSFDSDSAYVPADRLVLARAPKEQLRDRSAYEFFVRFTDAGHPIWSREVGERGSILARPGKCYRCGVSYHAATDAYLLAMLPGGDTRESGGLAVFTAPEPWGPWRAIFEADEWDVGPGESASFPTRWMSSDEPAVHLVFSGNDSFSLRRGELQFAESPK